jgi:hypothetical protein
MVIRLKILIHLNLRVIMQELGRKLGNILRICGSVFLCLIIACSVGAQEVLRDGAPERYTVVKGDTLWDIAAHFLNDPWKWPEIWEENGQIENPDLIYPGDVLVVSMVDGEPVLRGLRRETVKVSPRVHVEELEDPIPTIDPSAIQPFLSAPLITDDGELNSAGYVAASTTDNIVMGKYSQFYSRGISASPADQFRIFRPGELFVDPVTGEVLGQEAVHVGDARLLRQDEDTARMSVLNSFLEVEYGDRLRMVEEELGLPYYYPRAPEHIVRGTILTIPGHVAEIGPLSVVVLNIGEREGMENGHVLRILSKQSSHKDPITGETFLAPEEPTGLLMIFRTFEKLSYALITNATEPIMTGDSVANPELR